MLFNVCNCVSASSLAASYGPLCAGGAGFVSAVIATLAAIAKTAPAKTLRGSVPEVDRLAVRMVTDNIVIQFVPTEKRDGLTIERRTGSNTGQDKPPRAARSGEWGVGMRAEPRRGVAAGAPLDGEAVALFSRHELDDDVVGDHAHRQPVHLRHRATQRFRRRRLGDGGERCDHRRDEAGAAGAERAVARGQ